MKVKLITVGKLKEKYLKDGIAEYIKRLGRFTKFESIELTDEKTPDNASEAENKAILDKEGQRILAKVGDRDYVIALAIEGKQFPSEQFSNSNQFNFHRFIIAHIHSLLTPYPQFFIFINPYLFHL